MSKIKIILVFIIILLIGAFLFLSSKTQAVKALEEVDYTQKATALTLYEFEGGELSRTISAQEYRTFDTEVSHMDLAVLTTKEYNISADKVHDDTSGVLSLSGDIVISYLDTSPHTLQSEVLIFDLNTHSMSSDRPTRYQHGKDTILTSGIEIQQHSATINLIGSTTITTPRHTILTSDATIYNDANHYTSNNATHISTNLNTTTTFSSKGFVLRDNILMLNGNIDIMFDTGAISTINMNIDMLNNRYTTDKQTLYQSDTLQVRSERMIYDEQANVLYLNENVKAIYN